MTVESQSVTWSSISDRAEKTPGLRRIERISDPSYRSSLLAHPVIAETLALPDDGSER